MSHHHDQAAANRPNAPRPNAANDLAIGVCRCGGVAAAGVPVVHHAGSVADPFVVGIPAQASPVVTARSGNSTGNTGTAVPVAGPVSYRGAPFEVDTTTGGAGRPVLVVFGGLVLALLVALAFLAPAPPVPATTTLAVAAVVVSVGAIVAVAAWMRTCR